MSSSNPWGVSLKKARQVPDSKPTSRPKVKGRNSFISKRRNTLRQTPVVPKSAPKKTSSRKYKLQANPFELSRAPIFGVVLRSRAPKTEEGEENKAKKEENYLDLNFKGLGERDTKTIQNGKKSAPTKSTPATIQDAPVSAPFGVRLKPVRRTYDKEEAGQRIYQIDLSPPKETLAGKYVPESKSFLELHLKKVRRTSLQIRENKPEFVELQLRHVVAPADGGPKRTVTQASFQIPLLKYVHLDDLLQQNKLKAQKNAKDPLDEVLQIKIQDLIPTEILDSQIPNSQTIRIHLRQMDPFTNKGTDLGPSIHVKLRKTPHGWSDDANNQKQRGEMRPSMQVSLKHVDQQHKDRHDREPDFAKIHLKSGVHVTTEVDEYEEEEIDSTDEEEDDDTEETVEDEEVELEDRSERLEAMVKAASPRNLRSSLPNLNFEQELPTVPTASSEEVVEEQEIFYEEIIEEEILEEGLRRKKALETEEIIEEEILEEELRRKKALETEEIIEEEILEEELRKKKKSRERAAKEKALKEKASEREPRSRARPLQRTRSRSLTEIDRLQRRRDKYIELKTREAEEGPKRELTMQQRRDLLMWYNRMKTPNKEDMKRRVAKLPPSCDITPDDVELLPWLCKGRFLDIRVMNQYFLEDWQGKDELKKTENGGSE